MGGAGLPGVGAEEQSRDREDRRRLSLCCAQGGQQAAADGLCGQGRQGPLRGDPGRAGEARRSCPSRPHDPGVPGRSPAHRRGRPAHRCATRHRAEPGGCAGLHRAGCKGRPKLYVATGTPCVVPAVPTAPASAPCSWRRQPIRDAILAFLDEPRQAQDVAAHIGRPVSTAAGHLAAMRRSGLVVRIAHGRYERTEPMPDQAPDRHGSRVALPVRAALAAAWAGSGHEDAEAVQEARSAASGGSTTACAGSARPGRVV